MGKRGKKEEIYMSKKIIEWQADEQESFGFIGGDDFELVLYDTGSLYIEAKNATLCVENTLINLIDGEIIVRFDKVSWIEFSNFVLNLREDEDLE